LSNYIFLFLALKHSLNSKFRLNISVMPPIPDGPLEDEKTENDLESAKFTKVF
jgi:hypothetical protein